MDEKNENNAGSDGNTGENCAQGQRQIKHDGDGAGDGDDKNRVQMTTDERDDTNDSQAPTGGDIMKYRALVARISYLSQDRPDLTFAAMQVCCAMANPSASGGERRFSPRSHTLRSVRSCARHLDRAKGAKNEGTFVGSASPLQGFTGAPASLADSSACFSSVGRRDAQIHVNHWLP